MSDAELVALAALVFVMAVDVQAANMDRAHRGESMAYTCVSTNAVDRLADELRARGIH